MDDAAICRGVDAFWAELHRQRNDPDADPWWCDIYFDRKMEIIDARGIKDRALVEAILRAVETPHDPKETGDKRV